MKSHRECPFCGKLLEKCKKVVFTAPYGLTQDEYEFCKRQGIRWDCKPCNTVFLFFFQKKAYFWDRDVDESGLWKGWRILTDSIIRSHGPPVLVSFT
jgi:hypothetical protein